MKRIIFFAYEGVFMSERFTKEEIEKIYNQPFMDLMFRAQEVHRKHFDPNKIQWSTLMSIKTGGCPEDCSYCSQSGHYETEITREKLVDLDLVRAEAKKAKEDGSTRFCMGGAWKNVSEKDMPILEQMISEVKEMGMETCITAGSVTQDQAKRFKAAGLDYYNHNIDTSRAHYPNIITTRTFDERLETIKTVQNEGILLCSGGILGLGESIEDRIDMLHELVNMEIPPASVPINKLVAIKGTPLAEKDDLQEVEKFEFVRIVATARILMPESHIRLSAGRKTMTEELQALCMMAGANSWFTGSRLLTTGNNEVNQDKILLKKLNVQIEKLTEVIEE
jgi:biotin synthase